MSEPVFRLTRFGKERPDELDGLIARLKTYGTTVRCDTHGGARMRGDACSECFLGGKCVPKVLMLVEVTNE